MKVASSLREEFLGLTEGRARFDEPMKHHTTFHIGGPAEIWVEPRGVEELQGLLRLARESGLSVTLLGGGANLLVRDEGIPGLTLHLSNSRFQGLRQVEEKLKVGAALPLDWLIREAQARHLSGVEFLAGVPGRVGGAVRMNAGTHDDQGKRHAMADVVASIQVMDFSGRMQTLNASEIGFGYRSSNLAGQIVLEAQLKLKLEDPDQIAERVRALWLFKKQTQDWSAPSVGCIFKNLEPVSGEEPQMASAGWLIDQVGLKGHQIGQAAISRRHANFIMNLGNAQAADVLGLIEEARNRVEQKFGKQLELEVRVVPDA